MSIEIVTSILAKSIYIYISWYYILSAIVLISASLYPIQKLKTSFFALIPRLLPIIAIWPCYFRLLCMLCAILNCLFVPFSWSSIVRLFPIGCVHGLLRKRGNCPSISYNSHEILTIFHDECLERTINNIGTLFSVPGTCLFCDDDDSRGSPFADRRSMTIWHRRWSVTAALLSSTARSLTVAFEKRQSVCGASVAWTNRSCSHITSIMAEA